MLKKKIFFLPTIAIFVGLIILMFVVNIYIKENVKNNIIAKESASELSDIDCILVLGCQVKSDGTPSNMLADRIAMSVELYDCGAAPKIIMSGDHGQYEYDEVNTMKQTAISCGIPSQDIFMDHAGFSTYESLYRAKEIFDADRIIIVTQEYHLYRALYIAKELGIDAYGVCSDYHSYRGQQKREIREILARCKDFIKAKARPKPTYMGEIIPVSGNGDITNDKN